MVTLALDTSTRTGSCAVLRAGTVLADLPGDGARSHAERLPADLMTVLDRGGVPLPAVDVFAVAIGPGAFTGLRVGIATMQGLALANEKPLIGVSVLDVLATVASPDPAAGLRRVATWVDAWRGEVYAAVFERGAATGDVTVERPDRLLPRLQGTRTLFIGDGTAVHRDAIRAAMGSLAEFAPVLEPVLAGHIGRMASARVAEGHRPRPDEIRVLYVRRPDAELARESHAQR
jgi:tRNA threonylcarbamoyladenosine biosynthesis protein TsaB